MKMNYVDILINKSRHFHRNEFVDILIILNFGLGESRIFIKNVDILSGHPYIVYRFLFQVSLITLSSKCYRSVTMWSIVVIGYTTKTQSGFPIYNEVYKVQRHFKISILYGTDI